MVSIGITAIYAAVLGLLFLPMTLRVGLYRNKSGISLGDGGDEELTKRIRAHANFTETVPIALLLIALVEMSGAGSTWIHVLGLLLVLGRISHYLQLSGLISPLIFRVLGMVATLSVYPISSIWLLLHHLG